MRCELQVAFGPTVGETAECPGRQQQQAKQASPGEAVKDGREKWMDGFEKKVLK